MWNNLPSSLKAELYDRISSPLFVGFMVSFFVWNFKAIVVLFSDITVFSKIHHFEYEVYTNIFDYFGFLFVGPLISSLAYIWLYPKIANRVYKYSEEQKQALKEIKVKIEDETPLTIEQSRKIKQEMTNLDLKYSQYVETTNKRLEDTENRHLENARHVHESNKEIVDELKSKNKTLNTKLTSEKQAHSEEINNIQGGKLTSDAKKDNIIENLSKAKISLEKEINSHFENNQLIKAELIKNLNGTLGSRLVQNSDVGNLIVKTLKAAETLKGTSSIKLKNPYNEEE